MVVDTSSRTIAVALLVASALTLAIALAVIVALPPPG
jgi:hypothetical protein